MKARPDTGLLKRDKLNMERYDYAKVLQTSDHELQITCTASEEITSMITQLKQFYPSILVDDANGTLPSGEEYDWLIKKLSFDINNATWWVIKQLCLHGWEPLGFVQPEHTTETRRHYQFKRKSSL